MSALMSPISNLVQPVEPAVQVTNLPPENLALTACLMGALAIAAPVQPGQWPHQSETPGTPEPWFMCSHFCAAASVAGLASLSILASGESPPFHLASTPSSVNGQ